MRDQNEGTQSDGMIGTLRKIAPAKQEAIFCGHLNFEKYLAPAFLIIVTLAFIGWYDIFFRVKDKK